jgi:hypothetical protein
MAITVMEVLKNLPRTNCGDCGQATCLAFATHVIKEGEDLNKCPHLTGAGVAMGQAVQTQQEAGVGRRRESLAISLEVLQDKVAPLNFAALAEGLGATYGEEAGRPSLTLNYFGHPLQVFKDELRYPPGAHADPWDAILLYNYIASQSREPVAGRWIAYNSLPNSVSKAKTLARLEQKLADHFAGQAAQLKARADRLGGVMVAVGEDADLQAAFLPLPKVPLLLLFWDAEAEEGFAPQAHLLFDASVTHYLDLEAMLFLVEHLMERLMGESES